MSQLFRSGIPLAFLHSNQSQTNNTKRKRAQKFHEDVILSFHNTSVHFETNSERFKNSLNILFFSKRECCSSRQTSASRITSFAWASFLWTNSAFRSLFTASRECASFLAASLATSKFFSASSAYRLCRAIMQSFLRKRCRLLLVNHYLRCCLLILAKDRSWV